MNERIWVAIAGLCGAAAVGADAAARHLLAGDPYRLDLAATAARYGLLHAAALVGVAALGRSRASGAAATWLVISGWCLAAGMVLFCGGCCCWQPGRRARSPAPRRSAACC
jgi:uncharacterized membrane protein YgdD (TMEM256/DUF423 family)